MIFPKIGFLRGRNQSFDHSMKMRTSILLLLHLTSLLIACNSFRFTKPRRCVYVKKFKNTRIWQLPQSEEEEEEDDENIVPMKITFEEDEDNSSGYDKPIIINAMLEEADELINSINKLLDPYTRKDYGNVTVNEIELKRVLAMKYEDTLQAIQPTPMYSTPYNQLGSEVLSAKEPTNMLPLATTKTTNMVSSSKPLLIVHYGGLVGNKLVEMVRSQPSSGKVQYIEANQLLSSQENELSEMMKGVRSVIISLDAPVMKKRNWLGQVVREETACTIQSVHIQSLLNAVMDEQKRSEESIKVILLGKACKDPTSIASSLFGQTENMEDNFILDCKRRNIPYTVVKVGQIIDDHENIDTSKIKSRGVLSDSDRENDIFSRLFNLPVVSKDTTVNDRPPRILEPPMVISRAKTFESTEFTRVSIAAEGLLRAMNHPLRNGSWALLSNPRYNDQVQTTSEVEVLDRFWDDEFLKLDGPEIARIPILYAARWQVSLLLQRITIEWSRAINRDSTVVDPKYRDLIITPFTIETFSNAIRVRFHRRESNYQSAREERTTQKLSETDSTTHNNTRTTFSIGRDTQRKSGYLSPEEEERLETQRKLQEQQKLLAQRGFTTTVTSSTPKPKNNKKVPAEGGLEIILEDDPYLRVRIRRSNMDAQTIVKEETERALLRILTEELRLLDEKNKPK